MRSPELFQYTDDEFKSDSETTESINWNELTSNEKLVKKDQFLSKYPNMKIAKLDVTSDTDVEQVVNTIIGEHRRIDILINNAGYGLSGTIEQAHIDEAKVSVALSCNAVVCIYVWAVLVYKMLLFPILIQALFDVNVWGPVRVMQAVLPYMRKQGEPTLKEAKRWLRSHGNSVPEDADGVVTDVGGVDDRYLHTKKGGYIINLRYLLKMSQKHVLYIFLLVLVSFLMYTYMFVFLIKYGLYIT